MYQTWIDWFCNIAAGEPPDRASSVRLHPSKHMAHNSCQFHSCFFDCPLHVPAKRMYQSLWSLCTYRFFKTGFQGAKLLWHFPDSALELCVSVFYVRTEREGLCRLPSLLFCPLLGYPANANDRGTVWRNWGWTGYHRPHHGVKSRTKP